MTFDVKSLKNFQYLLVRRKMRLKNASLHYSNKILQKASSKIRTLAA